MSDMKLRIFDVVVSVDGVGRGCTVSATDPYDAAFKGGLAFAAWQRSGQVIQFSHVSEGGPGLPEIPKAGK